MNADAMITTVGTLKLFGMAETIIKMAAQASPACKQAAPILDESGGARRAFHQLPDEGGHVPDLPESGGLRHWPKRRR